MIRAFFSSRLFIWIVVVSVVAVLGYGLVLSGSPAKQRQLQFDQRRTSDLEQIAFGIDEYWLRNQKLPGALAELQDSRYYYVSSAADPETGVPYEYRQTGEKRYELCAVFATDTDTAKQERFYKPGQHSWQHGATRTCFPLEVQARQAP